MKFSSSTKINNLENGQFSRRRHLSFKTQDQQPIFSRMEGIRKISGRTSRLHTSPIILPPINDYVNNNELNKNNLLSQCQNASIMEKSENENQKAEASNEKIQNILEFALAGDKNKIRDVKTKSEYLNAIKQINPENLIDYLKDIGEKIFSENEMEQESKSEIENINCKNEYSTISMLNSSTSQNTQLATPMATPLNNSLIDDSTILFKSNGNKVSFENPMNVNYTPVEMHIDDLSIDNAFAKEQAPKENVENTFSIFNNNSNEQSMPTPNDFTQGQSNLNKELEMIMSDLSKEAKSNVSNYKSPYEGEILETTSSESMIQQLFAEPTTNKNQPFIISQNELDPFKSSISSSTSQSEIMNVNSPITANISPVESIWNPTSESPLINNLYSEQNSILANEKMENTQSIANTLSEILASTQTSNPNNYGLESGNMGNLLFQNQSPILSVPSPLFQGNGNDNFMMASPSPIIQNTPIPLQSSPLAFTPYANSPISSFEDDTNQKLINNIYCQNNGLSIGSQMNSPMVGNEGLNLQNTYENILSRNSQKGIDLISLGKYLNEIGDSKKEDEGISIDTSKKTSLEKVGTILKNLSDFIFDKINSNGMNGNDSNSDDPLGLKGRLGANFPSIEDIKACKVDEYKFNFTNENISKLVHLAPVEVLQEDVEEIERLTKEKRGKGRPRKPRKNSICPFASCKKKFNREYNLKEHIKIHNPIRNKEFICKWCNESFYSSSVLSRHISSIHHGEQYSCRNCGKKFNRKDALHRHEKSHCHL